MAFFKKKREPLAGADRIQSTEQLILMKAIRLQHAH